MIDVLDETAVDAIAALCAQALHDPPTADELRSCLFAPDQPTVVRGDPDVGVVVAVPSNGGGSIRLLAVHPDHRRRGHGAALLRAAEHDLVADHGGVVTIGADAPYYLFAGVETSLLPMLYLLERRHYARHEANFNMDVDLAGIPADRDGPRLAGPSDRDDIDAFTTAQWPNWKAEVLRALAKSTLVIGRDESGITGFCAWDVNRAGLVGPVAVRLDLMGQGVGEPLLIHALHRIRASGRARVEVSWVGPIVPYARVGGTVGRVFFVYRKTFAA